jgi:hypothetical protein
MSTCLFGFPHLENRRVMELWNKKTQCGLRRRFDNLGQTGLVIIGGTRLPLAVQMDMGDMDWIY